MLDLSGKWSFQKQEPTDSREEAYFLTDSATEGDFMVPGSTIENGIGDSYIYDHELTPANVQHLRKKKSFIGKLWLRRTFTMSDLSDDKQYTLVFERVMWQSRVWLNGHYLGSDDSLSTPHRFDLTNFLKEENELIVCIDNQDIHQINTTPSAYTEETQSIWNGLVGKCVIEESEIGEPKLKVSANYEKKQVSIDFLYDNRKVKEASFLRCSVSLEGQLLDEVELPMGNQSQMTHSFSLQEFSEWDEFEPTLYEVTVEITNNQKVLYQTTEEIGFRKWSNEKQQLLLNDHPAFLRGTIDCCIFPMTGYPPTDEKAWEKIFHTIKDHGLNHVRFHSWCPPEAAFKVADRLGLYLQVEGPIWLDEWMTFKLGDKSDHYTFFLEESRRIVVEYGHHPSFCFFSCGNEIRGDYDILRTIVKELRKMAPQILYTLTTNWDREIDPEDDLFIAQTADKIPLRGQYELDKMVETTQLSFDEAVAKREVPILSHEVGQYHIYPRLAEITKYTGNLQPINLLAIQEDLNRKQMGKYASAFTRASGKLAFNLYKDDIEAALRTKKLGGYQLLGLNDFSGQSTATVGLLDVFWEDKGLMKTSDYKQFSAPLVHLAIMDKRIFSSTDEITIKIQIANYYHPVDCGHLSWQIASEDTVYVTGSQRVDVPLGLTTLDQEINWNDAESIKENKQLTLSCSFETKEKEVFTNSWRIWIFPKADEKKTDILESDELTEELLKQVANGKKLLLSPKEERIRAAEKIHYFPVFWSPVHFKSKDNCGLMVHNEHALFQHFPSLDYADYQWKDLVTNAFSVPFTTLSEDFEPIVQAVPNFFNHKKMFALAEFNYGKGKIMLCSLNIQDESLVNKSFKQALLNYMASNEFVPNYELSSKELKTILYSTEEFSEKVDFARKARVFADSQRSESFSPEKAIDQTEETSWQPEDNAPGHWWTIDLGETKELSEIRIELLSNGTYYYNVETSVNDKDYEIIINKAVTVSGDQTIIDALDTKARFVKINYADVSDGVTVGHKRVSLY